MLKTYLYLPEDLKNQIIYIADSQNKSRAEIIRRALKKGIVSIQGERKSSAEFLLKLAEIGKNHKFKGPKDGSQRIDELLWGKDWSKDE